MAKKGAIKMLFPGGNTCLGFHSFYKYIIEEDANQIFIIKGGPGTGKSTLMREIATKMQELGFDVELHICSSDPNSLDAIVIPALQASIIDGTAPHITDPRHPGVVEEIVNLGECWEEGSLKIHKKEILQLTQDIKQQYEAAYSCLWLAETAKEQEASLRKESLDTGSWGKITGQLLRTTFGEKLPWDIGQPKERHLFAWALTSTGLTHHLSTVLSSVTKLIKISGKPGSGKATALNSVASLAGVCGLTCEIYHCALNPASYDLIVLPELKTAVLNDFPELKFDSNSLPFLQEKTDFNFDVCVLEHKEEIYKGQLQHFKQVFQTSLVQAFNCLRETKAKHDLLEEYYKEAVDFQKVTEKKDYILAKILKLAQKTPEN